MIPIYKVIRRNHTPNLESSIVMYDIPSFHHLSGPPLRKPQILTLNTIC